MSKNLITLGIGANPGSVFWIFTGGIGLGALPPPLPAYGMVGTNAMSAGIVGTEMVNSVTVGTEMVGKATVRSVP